MNAEPIGVEFELTPEEWVEVSMAHSATQPQIVKASRNVRFSFGLICVLFALILFLSGASAGAMTFLIAAPLGVALLGPLIRSTRRKQLTEYARTGIANGMFGRHRVELHPDGMLDVTDGYEWLTRWPAIERVEEGESAFLIYTGPNALLPIPHSAFRDAASLRRFSNAFFAFREEDTAKRISKPDDEGSTGVPHRSAGDEAEVR